jgi:hypothetical protein
MQQKMKSMVRDDVFPAARNEFRLDTARKVRPGRCLSPALQHSSGWAASFEGSRDTRFEVVGRSGWGRQAMIVKRLDVHKMKDAVMEKVWAGRGRRKVEVQQRMERQRRTSEGFGLVTDLQVQELLLQEILTHGHHVLPQPPLPCRPWQRAGRAQSRGARLRGGGGGAGAGQARQRGQRLQEGPCHPEQRVSRRCRALSLRAAG